MPIVGTGISRVISAASASGTHSSTMAKHPASARACRVLEDLARGFGLAPLDLEAAELAVRLRRQPDVTHHRDVGREDRLDGGEDPPPALDLDRRASGLGQEAARVLDGAGRLGLVREEGHVADDDGAFGGARDRAGVPDHRVHRGRERVRLAVDRHLDRVADEQNVDAGCVEQGAVGAS